MKKHVSHLVLAALICTVMPSGKVWLGMGYFAARYSRVSAGEGAAIGGLGLVDSTLWSWAAGAAFGGPVGLITGAAVGA